MIKICILGIIVVVICTIMKLIKPEYCTFVLIAGALIIIMNLNGSIKEIIILVKKWIDAAKISQGYTGLLLKTLGIGLLSSMTSDMCKDTGYSGVGNFIELSGKISIVLLSAPVIINLIEMIEG